MGFRRETGMRWIGLMLLSWLLLGCGLGSRPGGSGALSGEVAAAEAVTLPPGAELRVRLEDISRSGVPGRLIAEQLIDVRQPLPIPFSLIYHPASIESDHRYGLRAEIRATGGELLWTTGGHRAVFGDGQPSDDVTLQVGQAGAEPQSPEAESEEGYQAPWAEAAARGIDFRAVGNEPGWHLEIDDGKRIQLVTDYGERTLYTPAPMPRFEGGVVRYDVRTEAHQLVVEIEPVACRDSMSGERFEARVAVTLDGTRYLGCGRYLATTK